MASFPFSKSLFWDVSIDNLEVHAGKNFVIERVLVRGGMNDVKKLFSLYNYQEIIEAIKKSKNLDKVTHNFCSNYFNIPKNEMHAPSQYY
jgi:hypothetical protein